METNPLLPLESANGNTLPLLMILLAVVCIGTALYNLLTLTAHSQLDRFLLSSFSRRGGNERIVICLRGQDIAFLIKPHVPSATAQHPLSFVHHTLGPELRMPRGAQKVAVWPRPAPQPLGSNLGLLLSLN